MNTTGKTITEIRNKKGFTQEELAEKAKVNLRTIQRLEKGENIPRHQTLQLICNALEIQVNELQANTENQSKKNGTAIINVFFLIVMNIALMILFGYLTLHQHANTNTIVAALLLALLLPGFIVLKTPQMTRVERLLKFGSGFIVYSIIVLVKLGVPTGVLTGFFEIMLIAMATLFYGDKIFACK